MLYQLYPALIPGEKAKNTGKYPHKSLRKSEIDLLVVFYDKHNGNISAMSRDSECQFNSYSQLSYYKNFYDLDGKLNDFRKNLIEKYTETKAITLNRAKNLIVMQAIKLATTREVTFYDKKKGEMVTMEIDPGPKDLDTAYKIMKTELGEPSSITKQENINKEEKEKIDEGLNLIKEALEGGK